MFVLKPSNINLMYKKNFGVSLIELLVTMTISIILAGISIPKITNWYKKDQFISQAEEVADAIYTIRANSFSEKKCPNDASSIYWLFSITNSSFSISCNNTASGDADAIITNFNDYISLVNPEQFLAENWSSVPLVNEDDTINIKIFSGGNQSKIFLNNSESFSVKKIKLPFVFNGEISNKRTICFDRIAGFPTISLTEDCND